MGFQNKTWSILLLVVISLVSLKSNAQDNQSIDLDFIYNEWALSKSESYDAVLVYVDEDDFIFDGIVYDPSSNLKFTSYDDTFYLKYSGSERSPWRCGNGPKYNGHVKKASWAKGIWNLEKDGDYAFLTLEHFNAVKGKKYLRTKWLDYQILELTEDRMILQRLIEQSIH